METVTYSVTTPRASGAVTFRVHPNSHAEFLIAHQTAPYYRVAFKRFTRLEAVRHWVEKRYSFKELPR